MDIPQQAIIHPSAAQIALPTAPRSTTASSIASVPIPPEILVIHVPTENYFRGGEVVGDSTFFEAFAVGMLLSGCIAGVIIWRMRRGFGVGRSIGRRDEEEHYTLRDGIDDLGSGGLVWIMCEP
ncbi:hypothetical protein CPB85DRAFT_1435680 [Mucidula mucida]|nr:hypothetical protein CPB85DRAFT_1435680 [Mucidula mucida]